MLLLAACGTPGVETRGAAPVPTAGPSTAPVRPTVLLFGDSLSMEAADQFSAQLSEAYEVEVGAFGGLALCDLAPQIVEAARSHPPAMILVQFSGNALGPCMRPEGRPPTPDEILALYRRDATDLLDQLAPTGVPVALIGSPPRRDLTTSVGTTTPVFAEVAAAAQARGLPVTFVDAGSSVAAPDGSWTSTLPCLMFETEAMGCIDGRIPVRAADGVHFCPGGYADREGMIGRCEVWSSGALRFATAMADVVHRVVPTGASPP